MRTAKIYTLIKEYPKSPKLGDRVIQTFTVGGVCSGYLLMSSISSANLIKFKIEDIENFSEHWKPHN